jgi:small multidrug resistance pump
MPMLLLALAISVEIGATVTLKYSDGFARLVPTLVALAGYALSFYFLALALKHIPVSTAYAIWSGAGTAAVAAIGFLLLGEPVSLAKIAGVAFVIAGVVLLNAGGVGR